MPTIHLIIRGKVQRVHFRVKTKALADELGLTGWVRNLPSGEVELIAHGPEDILKRFADWCRQGPARAVVTGVDLSHIADQPFEKFKIER